MENLIIPASDSSKQVFTSKFLVEQINVFRKAEGNQTELLHKNLIVKIEKEFEEEINGENFKPVEIKDAKGEMRKAYELNFEQSLQLLMSESKSVRKACVEVMKSQQAEIDKLKKPYSVKELLQMQLATIERAEEAEAKVLALEAKNEKLQYRSDFVDVCFETDGLFSMEQSVKILKLPYGRNILFQKLRENGVLTISNTPMQKYISNGYFKVVEELVENGRFKKLIPVTYATQKGIGFMHKTLTEI